MGTNVRTDKDEMLLFQCCCFDTHCGGLVQDIASTKPPVYPITLGMEGSRPKATCPYAIAFLED